MEKKMFYKADPLIFKRAKELRNNPTHTEMLLWGFLRTRPLGNRFRRQHPFHNYIADFYCHSLKLIIEVDGSIHYRDDVKQNDLEKEVVIKSLGIHLLRFSNKKVLHELDFVIHEINSFIQRYITKNTKEGTPTPPLGGRGVRVW